MALIAFIYLQSGSTPSSHKSANKFLIHLNMADGREMIDFNKTEFVD
jgi:hypothetical protein